jgi:hypothetical protein
MTAIRKKPSDDERAKLRAAYENASGYPRTTPEMFEKASLICNDKQTVTADGFVQTARITKSDICHRLANSQLLVPAYNVQFQDKKQAPLKDRIAIVGIGSNCAPPVLLRKFKKSGIRGDFYLAQAVLKDHAVVHSAFVGSIGSIPATVIPHKGTDAQVTVGFYTPEQAAALTGTEPNYDLVHKHDQIFIGRGDKTTALAAGALLYVSIWGALTEDHKTPVLQSAIPQSSVLKTCSTAWAIQKAAQITGYDDTLSFIGNIKPGPEHLATRLQHSFEMHRKNSLPAVISGTQIKQAGLYKQVPGMALPPLPRVKYQ